MLFACTLAGQDTKGLPNFQVVNEHVLRGGQPTDEGFQSLSQRGVKTVIDLRLPGEHSIPHERQVVETNGMRFVSVPMKGLSAPTYSQISQVLSIMNDQQSWPVFVHCRRGADRTGTVVACYRIQHDAWDSKQALQEAEKYGIRVFEFAMRGYIKGFRGIPAIAGPSLP